MGCGSSQCRPSKEKRILLLGLDFSGKTAIMYRAKLGKSCLTVPTIGFNVDSVPTDAGMRLTIWDIGGQAKIRPLWRHYYQNVDGLIYVVDSADLGRMEESRESLMELLNQKELEDIPLLVLANKRDLSGAMNITELCEVLGLNKLEERPWHLQPSSVTTGEGIQEGLNYMANELKKRKK